MASEAPAASPAPWHAAFPAPKDVALGSVSREEVLQMIKGVEKGAARDFVLVDVRRNDHEVCISLDTLRINGHQRGPSWEQLSIES